MSELTSRQMTHDVDLLLADARLSEIISHYHALNSNVSAYVDSIPYNFDNRLVKLDLTTRLIDYFVPSVEDMAVMKLYGWRENDQEDLNSPEFISQLNWNLLDELVFSEDEAQASMLVERRYKEMRDLYINYAEEHGHEPQIR